MCTTTLPTLASFGFPSEHPKTPEGWRHTRDGLDRIVGRVCVRFETDESRLLLACADGTLVLFHHEQDCCEEVTIEDICGDLHDLLGTPLLVAEQRSSQDTNQAYGSATWTFTTLRTLRGTVDIRWHGVSNGYYSEEVHIQVYVPLSPPSHHAQLAAIRDAQA